MIVYIMVILMLIYESILDIKKKQVHLWPVVVTGIMGAIINIGIYGTKAAFIIAGTAVGGILLLMSFLSRQQLGYGDAMVFIALGMCLGPISTLWVLWLSMIAVGVAGIVGIIRKKQGWHSQLPYIPYVTAGYIMLLPLIWMGQL